MARDVSKLTSTMIRSEESVQKNIFYEDLVSASSTTSTGINTWRGRSDLFYSNGFDPTLNYGWDLSVTGGDLDYIKEVNLGNRYYIINGRFTVRDNPVKQTLTGKDGLDAAHISLLFDVREDGGRLAPIWDFDLIGEANNLVLGQLLDQDFSVSVAAGELVESISLMRDSLEDLLALFTAVRKRKWKDIGKRFGVIPKHLPSKSARIAEAWLAYKLGWEPLINDIFSAKEAIIAALGRDDLIKSEARVDKQLNPIHFLAGNVSDGTFVQFAKVGITCKIQESNVAFLNSIGLHNPLAAGWELLPLSFLFDYFVNAGNFLSGLGAAQGLDFMHGYTTHGIEGAGTVEGVTTKAVMYSQGYEGHGPVWAVKLKVVERVPLITFPQPRLRLGTGLSTSGRQGILAALVILAKQPPPKATDLQKYGLPISRPVPHFWPGEFADSESNKTLDRKARSKRR